MILNEIQYESAKSALEDFKGALTQTESDSKSPDWLKELEVASINCQIRKFGEEISVYEDFKSGSVEFESQYSVEDLKPILPRIRIAIGMTQEDVANSIGIDERKFRQL